jgi:DNA polymerase III epsilon subunit-like protein
MLYLNVPFQQKDEAKRLGARWDKDVKKWYIPTGVPVEFLTPWLVEGEVRWEQGEGEEEGEQGEGEQGEEASSTAYTSSSAVASIIAPSIVPASSLASLASLVSGSTRSTGSTGKEGKEGRVAVFDIETTSLYTSSCRIVQMCCKLCDRRTLEVLDSVSVFIKSDGFKITATHIHGITEEISSRGEPFVTAAMQIHALFSQASAVVAHNVKFDLSVFQAELFRYELFDVLETVQSLTPICSMQKTRSLCNLTNKAGGSKAPKLDELFEIATGRKMQNHHNAEDNVANLVRALRVLLQKGIIDLDS